MGRAPCCDKANVKKGPWSPEEDTKLKEFIEKYGTGGNWIALPHKAGLRRCGKSCRLRWLNYLRPNIKHGEFSDDEDRIICSLFATIGSRWSIIAAQLPGRTDNDIKNYWNTKLKKKLLGIAPSTTSQRRQTSQQQNQQQNQQQLLFSSPSPSSSSSVALQQQPSSSSKHLFSHLQDHYTFPHPAPTTAAAFSSSAPQDHLLFNFSTGFFQPPSSSSLPNHDYQISFGDAAAASADQQSCSSSDQSYEQQQQQQQLGFESYLYSAVEESQKLQLLAGQQQQQQLSWGLSADQAPPLEYGYDEIKSLISSSSYINLFNNNSSTNNNYVDDIINPAGGGSSSLKTQVRGEVMYHF